MSEKTVPLREVGPQLRETMVQTVHSVLCTEKTEACADRATWGTYYSVVDALLPIVQKVDAIAYHQGLEARREA